jgi:hypothetical protein
MENYEKPTQVMHDYQRLTHDETFYEQKLLPRLSYVLPSVFVMLRNRSRSHAASVFHPELPAELQNLKFSICY